MPRTLYIPVIDLFAGPGGLGEGFSAYDDGNIRFKVCLSIEKDPAAHQTLTLRSFFRQFPTGEVPPEYFSYLKGDISRDALFEKHLRKAFCAESCSLLAELGETPAKIIDDRIDEALLDADEWILIGGPPCQAYSVVGRSRRTKVARDEFEADKRHYLYQEYLRIIAKFSPAVFVMENVKGLLSATLDGQHVFGRILNDLANPSCAVQGSARTRSLRAAERKEYRIYSLAIDCEKPDDLSPSDFVIEAERYGIPQKRHRVILFGLRADLAQPKSLALEPSTPLNVEDVLTDLPRLRSQLSTKDSVEAWRCNLRCGWQRGLFAGIEPPVKAAIWQALAECESAVSIGGRTMPAAKTRVRLGKWENWFIDAKMNFICNHESRRHMNSDLVRYLFVSGFGQVNHSSPKLHRFPKSLLPDHQNVKRTIEGLHGNFNDRFRVQVANEQATTVTCHIAKDGHYFIHHDPSQCRSWTVREAARVQTFPDNYFFEGTRTDQYRQVGNAVPPLLALQIAAKVAKVLKGEQR